MANPSASRMTKTSVPNVYKLPSGLFLARVRGKYGATSDTFQSMKGAKKWLRLLTIAVGLLFTGLAVAQGLPRFGTARFGEAAFGVVQATPVPFMPLWATVTLAASLWVVVYLMRVKES